MEPDSKQAGKPTEPASLEDCLLLLLRGIQNHPVIAEESQGQEFRAELAALERQFTGKENAHHLVESAIGILDRYSGHANEVMAQQRSALAKASSDLAAATKGLAGVQGPADRLASLEQQIGAISNADDLASIKSKLISEVTLARTEAQQERQKVSDLISGTITELSAPSGSAASGVPHVLGGSGYLPDPLTGLPARREAEVELIKAHELPIDTYLAIFVVKRLALINSKFGFARGDQLLIKVASQLGQSLAEFNRLFRWAPCAFITLAPPGTAYRELRSKVQVIEVTRMTPTLEWQGRSAMVPVALDCRVISTKDFGTASELFLRLDTFASTE
jgi:GGDEF domain-containing protein